MKKEKKPYVRPVDVCTEVRLESPICTGSAIHVKAPDGNGINAQEVNTTFGSNNDFYGGTWDVGQTTTTSDS